MQTNFRAGIGVILCSLICVFVASCGDRLMRQVHRENQMKFIEDSIFLGYAQIDDEQVLKILQDTVIPFAQSKGFSSDSLNIYIEYRGSNEFRDPKNDEGKKFWPQYYWHNRYLEITIENTHNSPWTDSWDAYTQLDGYIIFLDRQFFQRFAYRKEFKPYRWFKCGLNRTPSACYQWVYKAAAKISPFVPQKYNPQKDEKSGDYIFRSTKNEPLIMIIEDRIQDTDDVW